MRHFIGIDGGGSTCRVRIADHMGRTLAEARGGPANIALDPEGALRQIRATALAAAEIALQANGQPAPSPEALLAHAVAVLGLAGANVAGAPERILPDLPFAQCKIVSDAITTLQGALGGGEGVVAALGTGSVFAAQRAGVYHQLGGWGFLLGDEGSGGHLGKLLVSQALRAVDGLCPMTPLLAQTLSTLGGVAAVVPFALSATSADFARLAPALFAQPDPAGAQILTEAETYITSAIDTLRGESALPVVWLGGLGPAWAKRIGARWPELAAQGSALDGAVLMARKDFA